jgi:hypothetical protein
MRRAIGFLPVVAALSLGCDVDLSGLDLSGLDDWTLPPGPVLNVTLAPDSLRLKVGEAAEIRETGGLNVRWSSRDSTIARPDPNAEWKSTAEVTALRPGETWIIGYLVLQPPDSVWVVVE